MLKRDDFPIAAICAWASDLPIDIEAAENLLHAYATATGLQATWVRPAFWNELILY
jgi:hypothetical protein